MTFTSCSTLSRALRRSCLTYCVLPVWFQDDVHSTLSRALRRSCLTYCVLPVWFQDDVHSTLSRALRRSCLTYCVLPVWFQDDVHLVHHIEPGTKEVMFNPKYEQLFAPTVRCMLGKRSIIIDFFNFALDLCLESEYLISEVVSIYYKQCLKEAKPFT